MSKKLKQEAIAGMIWSSIGKFGTLGLSFISNLILARLLMPRDFGYIGMLSIFLAISQVFISGGLGSALIQKKKTTQIDYDTVFYWNLVLSIILVVILFFAAPSIAKFYNMALLKDLLRILSLGLVIGAFSMIQSTQLQKNLRFKELSIRNIIATLLGVLASIVMALNGYGVWSLVVSSLLSTTVSVFLLWKMSTWRPTFQFSLSSLRELFSFGGLILLSSLVETIYTNIQGLIIGKSFSAQSLGYYTQARKLEEVPTNALSSIVNQVSFPIFSQLQDNLESLRVGVRKNIKAITFLNFPLMVMLIVIARPLILLLYTEKWEISIQYFQILCIGAMFYTINTVNTNVIKSLGKGKIYFWIQLIKRLIGIILIIFSIQYGIEALLWAVVATYYISFLINGYTSGKLIDYGIISQIRDIWLCLLLSVSVGVITYYLFLQVSLDYISSLLLQIIVYTILYLFLSLLMKNEGFFTYYEIIKAMIYKNKKKSSDI